MQEAQLTYPGATTHSSPFVAQGVQGGSRMRRPEWARIARAELLCLPSPELQEGAAVSPPPPCFLLRAAGTTGLSVGSLRPPPGGGGGGGAPPAAEEVLAAVPRVFYRKGRVSMPNPMPNREKGGRDRKNLTYMRIVDLLTELVQVQRTVERAAVWSIHSKQSATRKGYLLP